MDGESNDEERKSNMGSINSSQIGKAPIMKR